MSATLLTRWLGLLLSVSGSVALLMCMWSQPEITAALRRYRQRLDADLTFLRRPAHGRYLLATQLVACTVLSALGWALGELPLLAASCTLAILPATWLSRQRAQRLNLLDSQLDPWLVALANALRGTPSLGEALSSTALQVCAPLSEELDQLLKEHQLGLPLDRALGAAGRRIGSRSLSAALLTLRIARSSGGSVSTCLEGAAAALREMSRLDGVVRTKTAEGKAQALVISVVPLPFFALLDWLDPSFLGPLTESVRGQCLLAAAGALWLVGILLARRIVQLEL